MRLGAVGDADRVLGAEVGGELLLEGGDLRAEDELPALERRPRSPAWMRAAQRRERGLGIEERDGHGAQAYGAALGTWCG